MRQKRRAAQVGGSPAAPSGSYGVLTVAVPPVSAPVLTSKLSVNDARPARAAVNAFATFGWSGNVISTTSEATRRLSISSRLLVTYRAPVETPVPDTL